MKKTCSAITVSTSVEAKVAVKEFKLERKPSTRYVVFPEKFNELCLSSWFVVYLLLDVQFLAALLL